MVDVLKQVLAGQVLELGNNIRDAPVGHIDLMLASALAAKTKTQFRAFDPDMSIFHGCEPKRFVFARVLLIADADESALKQLHDRGQDFVSRQSGQLQILRDSSADLWEGFAETDYTIVFVFVANFAPAIVVNVLLATARVATRRLNVTVRQRRNPNLSPRRRNGEAFQPPKPLLIANQFSTCVQQFKIVAFRFTRVTGPIVAYIKEASFFGCVHRFRDDLRAIPVSVSCPTVHVIQLSDRRCSTLTFDDADNASLQFTSRNSW